MSLRSPPSQGSFLCLVGSNNGHSWCSHNYNLQITSLDKLPNRYKRIHPRHRLPSALATRVWSIGLISRTSICEIRVSLGLVASHRTFTAHHEAVLTGKKACFTTYVSCVLLCSECFTQFGMQHAMSIPILLFMWSEIADGWRSLATSSFSGHKGLFGASTLHAVLALNVVTQAVCVSSVNNLTSVRIV